MELVERYLQAVKFWLPREQQEDIARELSEDIVSEIEEEERGLGRLMKPAEIEATLKRRGRPFVVANRYLPQRQMIGPLLFPIYAFVLKVIGLVYVLPWMIVWILLLAFVPSYRGHVGRDLGSLWLSAVHIFAIVTILFAIQEHAFGASKLLEQWDPQRLPSVREREVNRVPRSSSIAEIVFNLLFVAWWAGAFPIAGSESWSSGTIWPEFHRMFFVPVLLIATITIVVAAVNVVHPEWMRLHRGIRALTNGALAAIAGWTVIAHRLSFQRPTSIGAMVDVSVLVTLAVIAVATTITCAREIYLATASSAYGTMSKLRS